MLRLSLTRSRLGGTSNQLVSPESDEGGSADVPARQSETTAGPRTPNPHSAFRMGNLSRRNQMQADGNSFPEFILGWTTGGKERLNVSTA